MNPSLKYEYIRSSLGYYFQQHHRTTPILTGLLFCRPTTKLAKESILPAVFDFHYSSGPHTHFYFPGYRQTDEYDSLAVSPATSDAPAYKFDASSFHEFKDLIQLKTKWKYSGGTDLILANARYDRIRKEGYLDFSCTICLQLESVQDEKRFPEIGMFFERIFQFAREYSGDNPVWGLSDRFAGGLAIQLAKDVGISLLPGNVKDTASAAFKYAALDINKNAQQGNGSNANSIYQL